jgi:hypothetical protein
VTFVAEIKSLSALNQEHQLRLGLGQLLRYRQRLTENRQQVVGLLIAETEPADATWATLCSEYGVILAWPEVFDSRLGPLLPSESARS